MTASYQDTPMDDWDDNVLRCASIIQRASQTGCCIRAPSGAMLEAIERLRDGRRIVVLEVDGFFHVRRTQ